MTIITAKKVFGEAGFTEYPDSVEILDFLDVGALKAYVDGSDIGREAAAPGSITVKIDYINKKPVTRIAANAFTPAEPGGKDDISTLSRRYSEEAPPALVIVLPESLELEAEGLLVKDLFAGVSAPVTVEIPPPVIEKIKAKIENDAVASGEEAPSSDQVKKELEEKLIEIIGTGTGSGEIGIQLPPADPEAPEETKPPVITIPAKPETPSTPSNPSTPSYPSYPAPPYTPPPQTPVYAAPKLTAEPSVSYSNNGAVSVSYTFDMAVNVSSADGWTITGGGTNTNTVIATPTNPVVGTPVSITLTAANPDDATKTVATPEVTVRPVSEVFSRPSSATEYTVAYSDEYGVTALKSSGNNTEWYYVTDSKLKTVFNAIYIPNAPGTRDLIESPKTTVSYNDTISEAVLGLFSITLDPTDAAKDKYEIKGAGFPTAAATGASKTNPIVIDIGIPGENNSGLPTFYIPPQGLGADATTNYAHIRFRVNEGANVVILTNNSGYIAQGAGKSCETGFFNGGCIEVMRGGKLRDGAFEGFPLGSDAVILNRLNSYLAVGPEPGNGDATGAAKTAYDNYYSGWLIGPDTNRTDEIPRIAWGTGDQTGNYIEVRPGQLAISGNVTVKKTLGLIYSVWFVGGSTVTIDAGNSANTTTIGNMKGLFANGTDYKFYGTSGSSGGVNTSEPTATIVIKPGSTLHKLFLTANGTDATTFITVDANATSNKTITNKGNTDNASLEEYGTNTGIKGYLNWDIP
jgi:hypothetical protein